MTMIVKIQIKILHKYSQADEVKLHVLGSRQNVLKLLQNPCETMVHYFKNANNTSLIILFEQLYIQVNIWY